MSDWQQVALGEICSIEIGGTPSRSEPRYWWKSDKDGIRLPWVSISDMKGKVITVTKESITEMGALQSNCKHVPKGTLLMSFKLTIGRLAFAGRALYTNEAISAIKPLKDIHPEFLYYGLQHWNLTGDSDQAVKGVTLNKQKLQEIPCLLPPLPEQKKIAEILSGVDDSIRREEERLDALSCLLQSHLRSQRFSTGEMVTMAEACLLVADCMHKTPEFEETGFPIVRTPNVRDGKLILEGMKFISEASYQEWIQKDKPEPGDILFTREAPLGEACLVPKDFPLCIGQRMMLLRPNPRILSPEFLLFRLRSLTTQRKLQLLSGGSTIGHANVKDIRSLEIEIPNTSEQRDAVSLYEAISKSINGHAVKRQKLLHLKSGLASDLLSGRKRVPL